MPASAGDTGELGSIPVSGRSPGGGHGNPLQYSCLENPIDREARGATVHGVAKSQMRLSMHMHTLTNEDDFLSSPLDSYVEIAKLTN